ncbi:D-alanyl-D-alanine carboxypeptidase [Cellulomonas hominis]|uniref:D-alanyl-D-alanine carboxypeptidase n=3 Tax=Cellulomonas hominis TaxID=156981 RepID=A0A7W8SHZ8_9CELL|nr:D-alanyl-D-alanine carboxypeptidase [Cellulomonas hominis]
MTPRPQHARGTRARRGRHRPAGDAGRAVRRGTQALATVVAGGLALGLAVHDGGLLDPPDPHRTRTAAPAADPAPRASAGAEDRGPAPAATPSTAGLAPAGDPRPSLRTPDIPWSTPEELTPPARAGLDLARESTTDPASVWIVVNKALPLQPATWSPPDLVAVGAYQVRAVVQDPLTRMLAAAAADGVRLELRSGFRSYDYQAGVHAGWAAQVGAPRADEVSARPGHSEHQTGLAVDVGSGSRPDCDFQDCFAETDEGRWVAARAGEFGFVVRYTAAGQAVTGFAAEGWHLRYVGTDLVGEMQRRGVGTLEELFDLPGGPAYR